MSHTTNDHPSEGLRRTSVNLVSELHANIARDDVLTVLRNAKRLAARLGITDIDHWLQQEQDGYDLEEQVPDYRLVRGLAVYTHGWVNVGLGRMMRGTSVVPGHVTLERPVVDPLRTVVSYSTSTAQEYYHLPIWEREILDDLRRLMNSPLSDYCTFTVRVSPPQFEAITEAVKDRIANWACELERRGIRGENMEVSEAERQRAGGTWLDARGSIVQLGNGSALIVSDKRNSIDTGGGSIDNRGGNIVQARDITDSFNALAEKASDQELAAKLRKLAETINTDILAKIPADQQKQVVEEAEELAKEATGKAREAVLKGLATAFEATVKAVAGWAVPIVGPLVMDVISSAVRR